ncbi:MAG: DUF2142 domain-containing protein [Selenomonadaceae bacterium]|nr:DUF2142 domain-containing protein [Selenomonadaceae bacterium]
MKNPEKIFVAVFLIFGVIICLVRPPYQLMDEPNHFARAWQISEGIFISPSATQEEVLKTLTADNRKSFGWKNLSPDAATEKMFTASVPVSLVPDEFIFNFKDNSPPIKFSFERLKEFLTAPLKVDEREAGLIPNTGAYSPLAYFPQVLGALLGRSLDLGAGTIYYLMNLSGLIFVATCIFLSMKFLPEAKSLIFLLTMMPMILIEAASTSIDSVTYGVSFLGTTWLLSLRGKSESFSRTEIFGLILLSIMLACAKSIYGTILLLYFLIPQAHAGSLKKFLSLGAAILFLNLFASLIWSEVAGVELATSRQYLGAENIDATAQKIFILENPQVFFAAMIKAFSEYGLNFFLGFIGIWGANVDVHSTIEFYILYGIILLTFALTNGLSFKIGERFILFFAAGISTVAFFLFEYVTWMPVGAEIIRGVQGRYFIPIAPMILFALSTLPPLRNKNLIALTAGISSGAVTLLTNFFAFY